MKLILIACGATRCVDPRHSWSHQAWEEYGVDKMSQTRILAKLTRGKGVEDRVAWNVVLAGGQRGKGYSTARTTREKVKKGPTHKMVSPVLKAQFRLRTQHKMVDTGKWQKN